jgi:spore coat protein CotH
MRLIRSLCLALAIFALAALMAQPALADEAAAIYDPSTVVFIDLTLSTEAETKLEAEPTKYVKGTFSMTKSSDGTPSGEESTPFIASRPVEVRLKGSVGGSFRKLSEKPGLKLKFKEANAVLGLRKMTLNNMVQDPSMLHETLAYASFRAAGVPASRTGFAYVRLNGNDIGVYLDLENLDDIGLSRIFNTSFDEETQHLYEGEQGSDVFPGGETTFEVDEGSEADVSDLKALIESVNDEAGKPFSSRVAPNADLAEMTKMWAVEKYIDHWDGYSGHADQKQVEDHERPNNYYLYSDSSGRFQMLPWGADQAWIATIGVETPGREVTFDGEGGVLFNKCLEDEACFRAYWEALHGVREAIAQLDPAALAESTADMLGPWQKEEEEHGRPEYDAAEIKEDKYGVDTTLDFIAGRAAEADAWLAAHEPPEEESGGGEEEGGGEEPEEEGAGPVVPAGKTATSSVGASSPPRPNGPPVPDLVPGRFAVTDGVLISHIWVSGAGALEQRVSIPTRHGRLRVCIATEQIQQVGPVVLRCKLSAAARRRLSKKPLRLKAYTAFAPLGRGATLTVRDLTASRDPSL